MPDNAVSADVRKKFENKRRVIKSEHSLSLAPTINDATNNDMPAKNTFIGDKLRPLEKPVCLSFDKIQKPLQKIAETVFAEIEKIHGIPQLSKLDIIQVKAKNFEGEFEYMKLGRGIRIKISCNTQNKELTLLHEIGHVIDNQAIGVKGMNDSGMVKSNLSEVLNVIEKTELIKQLRIMQKTGKFEYNNKLRKIVSNDYNYLNYLLQPKEIWARAYSQYIAMKSGNIGLIKQLKWEEKRYSDFKTQWLENDFKEVIFEIERFLITNKWAEQLQ